VSLQTAPKVPSPHLVHDGRAPSDGAPSSLPAVAKRAVAANGAAVPRGTADTQKGIVEAVSRYATRSASRNRRREGTLGAVLAKCGQIANPDVAVLAGLDN
jgi:hypothetical protein